MRAGCRRSCGGRARLVCLNSMPEAVSAVVPGHASVGLVYAHFGSVEVLFDETNGVVLVAAAGEDAGEGQEDVEAVEVDAEGEFYGGGAVTTFVDAHEVDYY
jgi:hypothetical protein